MPLLAKGIKKRVSTNVQPGGAYGVNLESQSLDANEPGVNGLASGSISQDLHSLNLERLADRARRELLEAIKYERNYSPLTWFKSVKIAPRETVQTIRKQRDGLVERLKLTSKNKAWTHRRKKLAAEIQELDALLVKGKH
jgi:hypothetical protein